MPKYQLQYFDGRGRAELTRLLFAASGTAFEDIRISSEEWQKLKPATPQGSLPILTIDGKKLCQSMAIARNLARKFNLYSSGDAMGVVDQILDNCTDIFTKFISIVFTSDEAQKATDMKAFETGARQSNLEYLNTLIKDNGKGGFAVGSSLTVADLCIYTTLESLGVKDDLAKFPYIEKNIAATAAHSKIAAYLKKRKVTPF